MYSEATTFCIYPPKAPPPVAPEIAHVVWRKEMQIWELQKEIRDLKKTLNALIVSCAFVQQPFAVDLEAMD